MSTPSPQQSNNASTPNLHPAAAPNSDKASGGPTPTISTLGRPNSQQPIEVTTPLRSPAAALNSDQPTVDASPVVSPADPQNSRHAMNLPNSIVETRDGAVSPAPMVLPQESAAVEHAAPGPDLEQQGHPCYESQGSTALLLWDPVLQTLADGLNDVEATRIAQANRYRILTTTKPDDDGVVRGFGLAADHPAVAALDAQLKTLEFLEAQMSKALQKQLRSHPLHPWIKQQKGLGDKTIARLLAAVRDPYWNDLHDRSRTVGELFAFCGVAGPGYRRQRGVKVNWNPDARKRLWIIATTIVKVGGPYRAIYDAGRERYAEKLHTAPCVMCGKKGQPALEGTEWRDGHKHAGAVRLVMREVLRDLWLQSRDVYEQREAGAA